MYQYLGKFFNLENPVKLSGSDAGLTSGLASGPSGPTPEGKRDLAAKTAQTG
jgi:hypothetical protein